MTKWGWKQAAIFMVCVLCATGILVLAGLAETPPPAAVGLK